MEEKKPLPLTIKGVLKSKKPKEISDISLESIEPTSIGFLYVGRTKWDNTIKFTELELKEFFHVPESNQASV